MKKDTYTGIYVLICILIFFGLLGEMVYHNIKNNEKLRECAKIVYGNQSWCEGDMTLTNYKCYTPQGTKANPDFCEEIR